MTLPWFALLAVLIGIAATRTTFRQKHALKTRKERAWWLLLVLGWLSLACWILAQFVTQD